MKILFADALDREQFVADRVAAKDCPEMLYIKGECRCQEERERAKGCGARPCADCWLLSMQGAGYRMERDYKADRAGSEGAADAAPDIPPVPAPITREMRDIKRRCLADAYAQVDAAIADAVRKGQASAVFPIHESSIFYEDAKRAYLDAGYRIMRKGIQGWEIITWGA